MDFSFFYGPWFLYCSVCILFRATDALFRVRFTALMDSKWCWIGFNIQRVESMHILQVKQKNQLNIRNGFHMQFY